MSFPRYPKYKDSGVEWLGEVPEHWAISRLGFESWVRARLGWKGLKAEEYVDDGFAFLSTPNIKGVEIDFDNVNYIDQHRFEESPEIQLKEGDVLLAKDGSTLGTVNVVRRLPRPATVNSSIAVITPGERIGGIYMHYLFESAYMENTIQRIKGGMGVPHLFQEDLNKFSIPLPTLNEQRAIAAFLDRETAKIDALIAEQQRLIELLQEKRQAVISHAVTKGLNPDAPMKDSGVEWLGEMPEHWDIMPVWLLFELGRGRVMSHGEIADNPGPYPVYSSQTENDGVMGNIGIFAYAGDYLTWTTDGANAGTVFRRSGRFNCTNVCGTLKARSDRISLDYAHRAIQSATGYFVRHDINPKLMNNVMSGIRIPVPSLQEQRDIASRVAAVAQRGDTLTAEMGRAITLLQERRSALISAAVTGQIDVRGLAGSEAA